MGKREKQLHRLGGIQADIAAFAQRAAELERQSASLLNQLRGLQRVSDWRVEEEQRERSGGPLHPGPAPAYTGPPPSTAADEALRLWRRAGRAGVVETTRGREALVALAAADALARGERVLVLVPGLDEVKRWREELVMLLGAARVGMSRHNRHDTVLTHDVVVCSPISRALATVTEESGLVVLVDAEKFGTPTGLDALPSHWFARLGISAAYSRRDRGIPDVLTPFVGPLLARCDEWEVPDTPVDLLREMALGARGMHWAVPDGSVEEFDVHTPHAVRSWLTGHRAQLR